LGEEAAVVGEEIQEITTSKQDWIVCDDSMDI
jgi:hypothetical protein